MKRVNPYTRLKQACRQWAFNVVNRRRVHMFSYLNADVRTGWRLDDLYQRVAAAEQLGYEVMIKTDDKTLVVQYVKKLEDPPWDIRP